MMGTMKSSIPRSAYYSPGKSATFSRGSPERGERSEEEEVNQTESSTPPSDISIYPIWMQCVPIA